MSYTYINATHAHVGKQMCTNTNIFLERHVDRHTGGHTDQYIDAHAGRHTYTNADRHANTAEIVPGCAAPDDNSWRSERRCSVSNCFSVPYRNARIPPLI